MKRSLLSLLLLGVLAACSDAPRGQLEPIPRPPGYQEPPKAEAVKPTPPPAPDPNKVVLRWKLTADAVVAFQLEGTPGDEGARLEAVYSLHRSEAGDPMVRISHRSPKASSERGTLSERGFILDGLDEVDRNLATLLLELPKKPVGVGDTWELGADLVDMDPLGPDFVVKKSERRHDVKLASLAAEGDEQVATILYDVSEFVSGNLRPNAKLPPGATPETAPLKPASGKDKGKDKGKKPAAHEEEPDGKPGAPVEISSEVTFKGRGEFLVKAGRWRSWQGTLSSRTQGYVPTPGKSPTRVPPGTLKLLFRMLPELKK